MMHSDVLPLIFSRSRFDALYMVSVQCIRMSYSTIDIAIHTLPYNDTCCDTSMA